MADAEGMATVAERIRHLIRSAELPSTHGRRLAVSVSIGAVLARQEEPIDQLCGRAERAAALAAARGHDRVILDRGQPRPRAARVLGSTARQVS
jgi:PleD family two-component response regulator